MQLPLASLPVRYGDGQISGQLGYAIVLNYLSNSTPGVGVWVFCGCDQYLQSVGCMHRRLSWIIEVGLTHSVEGLDSTTEVFLGKKLPVDDSIGS